MTELSASIFSFSFSFRVSFSLRFVWLSIHFWVVGRYFVVVVFFFLTLFSLLPLISTNQLKIELQHSFQKEEQIGQKRRRRSWTARERSRDRDIFFCCHAEIFRGGKEFFARFSLSRH
jgi:hypothetical protein